MSIGWARRAAFAGARSDWRKDRGRWRKRLSFFYFASTISREKILFTIRHSPPYFTSDM